MILNRLPAFLACTLALGVAACSSDSDNSGSDPAANDGVASDGGGTTAPGNDTDSNVADDADNDNTGDVNEGVGDDVVAGGPVDGTTLQGTWRADCDISPSSIANSDRETIRVVDNRFALITESYPDNACASAALTTVIEGTFVEAGDIPPTDNGAGANVNLLTGSATLTPLTGLAAAGLNLNATCGRTDWTNGVMVDVANCVEIENSAVPAVSFDLYLIESTPGGDILYLGVGRSNELEDRPTEPDFSNPYQRVE